LQKKPAAAAHALHSPAPGGANVPAEQFTGGAVPPAHELPAGHGEPPGSAFDAPQKLPGAAAQGSAPAAPPTQ
jgi:hypothetical protein